MVRRSIGMLHRRAVTCTKGLAAAMLGLASLSCVELQVAAQPEKPAFTLVHLTDTECAITDRKPGPPPIKALIQAGGYKFLWKDRANSFPKLEQTVSYLNKEVRPDLVIHTGDIADRRKLSTLQRTKTVLDGLDCPYHVLMGDNDLGKPLAEFKKDPDDCNFVKVFGRRNTAFGHKGWRFILLSAYPGEEDIAWLGKVLETGKDRPTVLCTHRLIVADEFTRTLASRYYRAGPDSTDPLIMPRASEVQTLLRQYPNVVLALSGHCHCSFHWMQDGTAFYTTAALVGVPVEFRVFRVYTDRIEMSLFSANSAADVRAGRWRRKMTQVVPLPTNHPKPAEGLRDKKE